MNDFCFDAMIDIDTKKSKREKMTKKYSMEVKARFPLGVY